MRFSSRIHDLHHPLVLRVPHEDLAQNPKEIRTLYPELVLRDVPGQSVEGRPHAQRLGPCHRRGTHLDPPRGEVVCVGCPPRRLRLCTALPLTRHRRARPLSRADSRIRTEPLPATTARSAAVRGGHASPSSVRCTPCANATSASLPHRPRRQVHPPLLARCSPDHVVHFSRAQAGHFSRASKTPGQSVQVAAAKPRKVRRYARGFCTAV
jgi:hypothetical protein